MLRAPLTIALAFLGVAEALAGGEPLVTPTGPPPVVALATALNRDGRLHIELAVPVLVPETRQKVVEVNGQRETVTYTVLRSVMQTATHTADGVHAFRSNGKKIAQADLAKLLAKRSAVTLFRYQGTEPPAGPDPYYTQVLRDDVVVLMAPQGAP